MERERERERAREKEKVERKKGGWVEKNTRPTRGSIFSFFCCLSNCGLGYDQRGIFEGEVGS